MCFYLNFMYIIELIISEHRSVKLNKEVNALQNEDQNLTKRINNIVARLQVVNAQLLNKRGCKADSMKQCELTQVEFSKKLLVCYISFSNNMSRMI